MEKTQKKEIQIQEELKKVEEKVYNKIKNLTEKLGFCF